MNRLKKLKIICIIITFVYLIYKTLTVTMSIYELRLNITSGTSYDNVFPKNPVDGAITISVPYNHVNALTQMILTGNTSESPTSLETDCIEYIQEARSGALKILVNFDCCDNIRKCSHTHRHTFNTSDDCMKLIVTSLGAGYHVVCSDYSLKALVGWWEDYLPGACPLAIIGTMSGKVQLIQDLVECRQALLPQQKPLADLTIPEPSNPAIGISSINCMQDTFCGVVRAKEIIDQNNMHYKVTVHSIITIQNGDGRVSATPPTPLPPVHLPMAPQKLKRANADTGVLGEPPNTDPSTDPITPPMSPETICEEIPKDEKFDTMKIGEYNGYIGQCQITFSNLSGTLSCSSCHLSNLLETNTSPDIVFAGAEKMYGRSVSEAMRSEYIGLPSNLQRTYTGDVVRRMVSSGYSPTN